MVSCSPLLIDLFILKWIKVLPMLISQGGECNFSKGMGSQCNLSISQGTV